MIYLFPHSGLANRIRVIVSGLHLAEVTQQSLVVFWKKDNSLFCDYADLFEMDQCISLRKPSLINNLFNTFQNKKEYLFFLKRIYNVDFTLFDKDLPRYVWNSGSNNINFQLLPIKIRNYYIATCHEFYFDSIYLKHLRPIEEIRNTIHNNILKFSNKTIGVHIRRTDHVDAIRESSLDSFITIMRERLDVEPNTNFFLATDDEQVELYLMKLFPEKIFVHKKQFSRKSVQGIKDAVVDLYCLAATASIYGSYFSSFSDIAARIGNIPLQVIRRDITL